MLQGLAMGRERRDAGETKYHLTSHPAGTSLRALAAAIKACRSCEQAHQQLREELGLDHFEGRTWLGLHHHALLTLISFAFLQHLRLQHVEAARAGPPPEPSLPAPRRALLARRAVVYLRCPTCNGRLVYQPPASA